MLPTILKNFDFTDSMSVSGQREQNNTSSQALYMMNNSFVLAQSDYMAKEIIKKNNKTDAQIKQAFVLCFNRYPQSVELNAARNLHSSFRRSKEMQK